MRKPLSLPAREFLLECFDYNQLSGCLTWKARPEHHFKDSRAAKTWNSRNAGRSVSVVNGTGYFSPSIDGIHYLAHRVIWKLVTGIDPREQIDHADGNRKNNKWSNLREATKQENGFNQSISMGNKTGFKGVSFNQSSQKFVAQIRRDGKKKFLGRFDSAEAAHLAYVDAAKVVHGQFFRSAA